MRSLFGFTCWTVSCLWLMLSGSSTPARELAELESSVRSLVTAHQGDVSIAIKHLESGDSIHVEADRPMPTASLIKVAVMIEAYRQADQGKVDLARMLTLREEDKVPGSGILTTHFSSGATISLRDAIRLMMAYSDNTATNLVVDQLGLPAVSQAMEQLSFPNTKLHAKVFRGETSIFPERSRQFGLGSTTAQEMLDLLEKLFKGELAGPASTAAMLDHMRACDDTQRLTRLLPPGTVVPRKTGAVSAVRTDAGIIQSPAGNIVVVLLTARNKDQRWTDDNASSILAGTLARLVYDHFNDSLDPSSEMRKELSRGANGWLVEALQRTLNSRLAPSPQLSIDGDFGPATENAVKQFQQAQGIAVTGVVTDEVWSRLGPLKTEEQAITDPESIAVTLSPPAPADKLQGAPFVSASGWIIGNPLTGEIVDGVEIDTPRPNASTTKLLTAYIALREADKTPGLLDELVTVSERADRTPGSTADLRAGEQLTFRELLYGLLLPSGNDASVVVAEHLGRRFVDSTDDSDSQDAIEAFVKEMNRTAAELGMNNTTFRNPHGLSADGHASTPRDLFKLATWLAADGAILPYVGTRTYIGTLHGAAGYSRYQRWDNTNRLLEIEGYLGMKTGTTNAAGACLVSLGKRDGKSLVVVVLGSSSTEARYVDTRNLFRWGWNRSLE